MITLCQTSKKGGYFCIKEVLKQLSLNYVEDSQLQNDIQGFIQEKVTNNHFPFAKSLELHYEVFSKNAQSYSNDVTACMEMLILASDIIDDIQDGDREFQNAPTSLNTALSMLMIAQKQLLEHAKPEYLQCIMKYLLQSLEGQHQDLYGDINNINQYLKMSRLKSGSLMTMAHVLGTTLAGFTETALIEDYSYDLGIAAQIRNDYKDATRFVEKSDWKQKRKTLPILFLLNPQIQEGELVRGYYRGDISFNTLLAHRQEVEHALKVSGAMNFTKVQITLHEQRALGKIDRLPLSPEKIELLKKNILN